MIDIIIPCYNSYNTLDRCIGSILAQNTRDFKITLVVDDNKSCYDDFKNSFVNILNYKDNKGPGYARNYGILNTKEEFIMFLDSDDALYTPFTLSYLLKNIKSNVLATTIIAENKDGTTRRIVNNKNFNHGKIYKRDFLEKNNILFNNHSCCEDSSFNLLCFCLTDDYDFQDFESYAWLYNRESLGRKNVDEWEHSKVPRGMVDNLIYTFSELEKRNCNNSKIFVEKISHMIHCLANFLYNKTYFPQYDKENIESLNLYYQTIYRPIENLVKDDLFELIVSNYKFRGDRQEVVKQLKAILFHLRSLN